MSSETLKIDKPRLICGILGELAVREIPLEIVDDGETQVTSVRFSFELDLGFRKSRIRLDGKQADTVRCKADYFGNTVFFTLTKDHESENYPLPKWIEADHWYIPEIDLPQFEFPTDICYPRGGIMGFAKKLAPDSVVITVDDRDFVPPQDALFHITFRHRTKNESAFHDVMLLERIEQNDSGLDLVFRHVEASPSENETRTEHPVEGLSLDFDSEPFGTHRFCGCIRLETLGLSDFSGSVQGPPSDFLVRGLVLRARYPAIRFTLERETEERCFFKVVDSDTEWWHFVQFHTDKHYGGNVDPEHLARLFTESGLIRGARRKLFGCHIAEKIPFVGLNETPELSMRFATFSDDSFQPSQHCGSIRFTDHSYFWQEGALGNFTSESTYDIYSNTFHKILQYRKILPGKPNKLFAFYKSYFKRNAGIVNTFLEREKSVKLKAFHVKGANCHLSVSPEKLNRVRIRDVDNISMAERFQWTDSFNIDITSTLDFWNPSECNSIINSLLNKICVEYKTYLLAIDDGKSTPLGIVFRHCSWLATNVTGIISALFIFPSRNITPDDFLLLLAKCASVDHITVGTDDLLIVGERDETLLWSNTLERFSPVEFQGGIIHVE